MLSAEATTVVGAPLDLPIPTLAATVENAVLLRYDTSIREFRITPDGLHVAATFESAEAALTGLRA